MKILLLGGIGEAKRLSRKLSQNHQVIYSLKGGVRIPTDVTCEIRVGGFGGVDGLVTFLREQQIDLLIDATHPYSVGMSSNARLAAQQFGVELWSYVRPPWQPQPNDKWTVVQGLKSLFAQLQNYRRPLFTIGSKFLNELKAVPAHQHWLVRGYFPCPLTSKEVTLINELGPFDLQHEQQLFASNDIDVLVSKNSGGHAVDAKLQVARERGLPVLMLARPDKPKGSRVFTSLQPMLDLLA
ncbi:MAG: precorrin-6A/cobalt-precorrin-6A reductase [Gammaproteobacteria bacterium]|nr:precorrin-6A/cobalt-precorrin-6A reductase [Gammaproteobacteria bacterium]